MESTAIEAVRKSFAVDVPIDHAFHVFTARLGEWWPATHHIGKQPYQTSFMEPRVGGRWYERGADGSECDWGHVLAWEPPARVVLSWNIGMDWQYNPDMSKASEVEVRFISEEPKRTRIEFEHRHIERHGEGAEKLRASVDGGWVGVLDLFRKLCEQ
jgi:uncharacterized protein YndB with AHSA1/START domain